MEEDASSTVLVPQISPLVCAPVEVRTNETEIISVVKSRSLSVVAKC